MIQRYEPLYRRRGVPEFELKEYYILEIVEKIGLSLIFSAERICWQNPAEIYRYINLTVHCNIDLCTKYFDYNSVSKHDISLIN